MMHGLNKLLTETVILVNMQIKLGGDYKDLTKFDTVV